MHSLGKIIDRKIVKMFTKSKKYQMHISRFALEILLVHLVVDPILDDRTFSVPIEFVF